MEKETIIALTTDIVTAHLSNNNVATAEIPGLIQSVFGALTSAVEPVQVEEVKPEPAVSIRSSVKPDTITCLECGATMKMLKRHLNTDHTMTPEEYKIRWGLPMDYPIVAPNYAAKRRELAVKIGLGRKPATKRKRTPARKPTAKTK